METYLLAGVAGLVLFYGGRILERLPKPKTHKDFTFEVLDHYVAFRVETLIEEDFDISYVDGWNVGRGIGIYGTVLEREDIGKGTLDFGKRTGVKIGPTSDWFQRSRIGYVLVFSDGGCEMRIGLPWQIARHLLEDLRRDPDQVVRIGIKKSEGKNGKVTYGIYSFELSTPFGVHSRRLNTKNLRPSLPT
jgi:hypothetical protein